MRTLTSTTTTITTTSSSISPILGSPVKPSTVGIEQVHNDHHSGDNVEQA